MSIVSVVLTRGEGRGGKVTFIFQSKQIVHHLRHEKANRGQFLINPRLRKLRKQHQSASCVSCIFHANKTEDSLNFGSHDIAKCLVTDHENENILEYAEDSKQGSVSSFNMEWDSQGNWKGISESFNESNNFKIASKLTLFQYTSVIQRVVLLPTEATCCSAPGMLPTPPPLPGP